MNDLKIVKFEEYCNKCKYKRIKETEDPCNECLYEPVQVDSRIPVNYEPAGGKVNGKE